MGENEGIVYLLYGGTNFGFFMFAALDGLVRG
jgi:hypothetical protein